MLEGSSLSETEFAEWSDSVVLFCHITSRVEGEAYGDLLSEKGGAGFPALFFMNASGDVIAKPSGRSVESFASTGKIVSRYVELKKKLDENDMSVANEVFFLELDLGMLDLESAKKKASELKLTDEEKKRFESGLFDLELMSLESTPFPELAPKVWKFYQEGKRPKGEQPYMMFVNVILTYGHGEKNIEMFEAGVNLLVDRFSEDERFKGDLPGIQEDLEKFREEWKGD